MSIAADFTTLLSEWLCSQLKNPYGPFDEPVKEEWENVDQIMVEKMVLKAYAPTPFARLRRFWGIKEEQFADAWKLRQANKEKSSGKSGSVFVFSSDRKYMGKSLSKSEAHNMLTWLPGYWKYMKDNPSSLVSHLLGLFRVSNRSTYFVLMRNAFYGVPSLSRIFDLKGSTVHRKSNPSKLKQKGAVWLDVDFMESEHAPICIQSEDAIPVLSQMYSDVTFLRSFDLMDYSWIIGVHHVNPETRPLVDAFLAERRARNDVTCFTSEDGDVLYITAIIDITQVYNAKKKMARLIKARLHDGAQLSTVKPDVYALRFHRFMRNSVLRVCAKGGAPAQLPGALVEAWEHQLAVANAKSPRRSVARRGGGGGKGEADADADQADEVTTTADQTTADTATVDDDDDADDDDDDDTNAHLWSSSPSVHTQHAQDTSTVDVTASGDEGVLVVGDALVQRGGDSAQEADVDAKAVLDSDNGEPVQREGQPRDDMNRPNDDEEEDEEHSQSSATLSSTTTSATTSPRSKRSGAHRTRSPRSPHSRSPRSPSSRSPRAHGTRRRRRVRQRGSAKGKRRTSASKAGATGEAVAATSAEDAAEGDSRADHGDERAAVDEAEGGDDGHGDGSGASVDSGEEDNDDDGSEEDVKAKPVTNGDGDGDGGGDGGGDGDGDDDEDVDDIAEPREGVAPVPDTSNASTSPTRERDRAAPLPVIVTPELHLKAAVDGGDSAGDGDDDDHVESDPNQSQPSHEVDTSLPLLEFISSLKEALAVAMRFPPDSQLRVKATQSADALIPSSSSTSSPSSNQRSSLIVPSPSQPTSTSSPSSPRQRRPKSEVGWPSLTAPISLSDGSVMPAKASSSKSTSRLRRLMNRFKSSSSGQSEDDEVDDSQASVSDSDSLMDQPKSSQRRTQSSSAHGVPSSLSSTPSHSPSLTRGRSTLSPVASSPVLGGPSRPRSTAPKDQPASTSSSEATVYGKALTSQPSVTNLSTLSPRSLAKGTQSTTSDDNPTKDEE